MPLNRSTVLQAALGIASLAACAQPARAGQIFVSNLSLPYSETVSLTGGSLGSVSALAGQQVLTANPGSSFNAGSTFPLLAWCVDFSHHIYLGGDSIVYTTGPLLDDSSGISPATSVALSATQIREIGALAGYGNALMLGSPSNAVSAAIQATIWDIEYGTSLAAGSDPTLAALVAGYTALAPGLPAAQSVAITSLDGDGDFAFQGLLYVTGVPEPGSLALLGIGLLGLGALRTRRR